MKLGLATTLSFGLVSPAGAQKGSLVAALAFAPKFLNPNYDFDGANYYMLPNMYSKLVDYDNNGKVIGDLAERWEVSPDGLNYTFHLYKGVKWSDGKELTADDVLFTINSLVAESGYGAQAVAGVVETTALDKSTVKLTLKTPNSSFLDQLAQRYGFVILPKHVYEGSDPRKNPANQAPVGSGPFVVEEFVAGNYVALKANPLYFRGPPKLAQLVFKFYPDMAAAVAALRSNQIGFIASAPPFNTLSQFQSASDINLDVVDSSPFTVVWVGFNLARKPLDDVRVRTAIAHAINRDQINQLIYGGRLRAANSVFVSTSWGHSASVKQPAFDVARANALLDEAGLARGSDGIRFKLSYTGFKASVWGAREIGEVMKQQLTAVGIDLSVVFLDFSVFAQKILQQHDFDIVWSGGPHGPDPQLFANYVTTKGNRNAMGYSNPEVDGWFEQARMSLDRSVAMQVYEKIQQQIAHDLPRLSLLEWLNPYVYRSAYKGFWWQPGAAGATPPECYRLVEM